MSRQEEDDLADAQPSVPRSNGHLPDRATAAGAPGSAPAFSGATPSRGDTPTPATSGVPVPGTVPFGRSRPRKPNRNEVVSGDPTLKHEQRESSLGPTNKIPARQHGRRAPTPREPPPTWGPPLQAERPTALVPPAPPEPPRPPGPPPPAPPLRIPSASHLLRPIACDPPPLRGERGRLPRASPCACPQHNTPPKLRRFAQKIIGGRCSACVKTKKGSCGTATAPRSCLRLQEGQRATSILPTLPPLPHHIYADQPKNDPYRALDDFILRWEEPPQPPRRPQEDEEEYPEEYYYDGSEGGGEEEAEAPEETDNAEGEGRRKPSPPTPSGGSGGSGSREDAE